MSAIGTIQTAMAAEASSDQPERKRGCQWRRRLLPGCVLSMAVFMAALSVCWILLPFPLDRLDHWPVSPVVYDRNGRLLFSTVGKDDQWRRPVPLDRISLWLTKATVAVEDERFYQHPGVDPIAIVRAIGQNVRHGRIVSGASTITMQIARMMDDRPRTWSAKTAEAFRAIQLERCRDKWGILETYLNMAPYGGNIRGVEAAAQAYFGKHAADLSLGEAALLAGLPQSPSRYRPDRHPVVAAARRQVVLRRMVELGQITLEESTVAAAEPVRVRTSPPRLEAPHAALLALHRQPAGGTTCIDLDLQHEVERAVEMHAGLLRAGMEVVVVVIEIDRGDIVALLGSRDFRKPHTGQVNGAIARRSPGSALKPFVYAAAFDAGRLDVASTVYDVPIERAGWQPENFDHTFAGPISVADALRRSLNVPAILVAEGTGLSRCVGMIESAGIALSPHAARDSGLAVVVGASEVTLLDLTNGYATLGRGGVRQRARLLPDEPAEPARVLGANICAAIDNILSCRRRRPRGIEDADLPWFMWKTGTSSGRRDAWAVGHNRRYAIGVWVGCFSGAGKVQLVGAEAAEPLLTSLFCTPAFRAEQDPPPAQRWIARNPLPPPPELAHDLRITAPAGGSTFVAVADRVVIHPRVNSGAADSITGDLAWFLNGLMLPPEKIDRLELARGQYELRCVDADGRAAVVRFSVR
ncbi:MAG TPA: penicillin-binding protein 1C [Phycisphaerae bacterium]|nr:penicillin-binding protein 1C [Phycisphaerae bacterium]